MRRDSLIPLITAATALAGCAGGNGKQTAIDLRQLRSRATLQVTSPSFEADQPISRIYSAYGSNGIPKIQWTPAVGAKSYALLVEDPDAPGARPFVHWIACDFPATAHACDSVPHVEGQNDAGTSSYYGPHPPIGDEPHHYHYEVFALDTQLNLKPNPNRDTLVAAMDGHILASGQIIGTYQEK